MSHHPLHLMVAGMKGEKKKEKSVPVLATAELPAKSIDLTAINLTELVNGMLNTALKGTKKFFSLLSITSYSSFAFHKVSVAVYNISNLKNVDPSKFPMRYCYCLNNLTNDLTDFTALLVDIIGNSTSYLTEIFKSTSIVSVSQSNDSECIYICVMAGQTGRNMSDFWEMIEKSPVINYTFSSNMSALLAEMYPFWTQPPSPEVTKVSIQTESYLPSLLLSTPVFKPEVLPKLHTASKLQANLSGDLITNPNTTVNASKKPESETLFVNSEEKEEVGEEEEKEYGGQATWGSSCEATQDMFFTLPPSSQSQQSSTGCPQAALKEPSMNSPSVTFMAQKINPCVMELCKFFQQCLCVNQRRNSRKEAMRYCIEYYSWFLKNATYICERVKRMAYSQTLKQKCLTNICKSV
ncbi:HERV-H LTR-associating protein 1 [Gopherus flavomarginatus]|uniref:HERV-H LTR-associating protein 1 n=1 Tax=Gopherus flavomarginatus TaxID=286002 RepID=UPI0021CBAD58|nr:HERV-H LTR-associating protein 1 [Gopherus flavomarginatus]